MTAGPTVPADQDLLVPALPGPLRAFTERLSAQVALSGPKGTAELMLRQARASVRDDAVHVWLELDLAKVLDNPLREGLSVRRGDVRDIPLLAGIPPVSAFQARARMAAGHELWLVLDGPHLGYAGWMMRGTCPALGLPGGQLPLPPTVVQLEDSVSPPGYRGSGVTSGGLSRILRQLGTREVDRMQTALARIDPGNGASLRAAQKIGFVEVARVHYARRGLTTRTAVLPAPGHEQHWLVQAYLST